MDKLMLLQGLEEQMLRDSSLPLRESNLVFGEGNADSLVVFIGEAPGFHEDRLGRPFVGRAGQLLDQLIQKVGWKREGVYITNIIKRRPPENRDPLPEEIEAYKPYLARQIEILNPRVIVPLGRFSMNYFLPAAKISRDQGKVFRVGERFVVPLFHPAAALRSTQVLNELETAFKKLPEIAANPESFLPAIEDLKKINLPSSHQPNPQESLF
ncbi:MAG: uracil-DNA glycosylase [Parcubacteria group bacterium]|nr:uracil-DNA glycosylase [Parcubacteria group bacterium]